MDFPIYTVCYSYLVDTYINANSIFFRSYDLWPEKSSLRITNAYANLFILERLFLIFLPNYNIGTHF